MKFLAVVLLVGFIFGSAPSFADDTYMGRVIQTSFRFPRDLQVEVTEIRAVLEAMGRVVDAVSYNRYGGLPSATIHSYLPIPVPPSCVTKLEVVVPANGGLFVNALRAVKNIQTSRRVIDFEIGDKDNIGRYLNGYVSYCR